MANRISNCIRNWCASHEGTLIDNDDCDELRALAVRIDDETVELPRDADGVPVHVGDTLYHVESGSQMQIRSLTVDAGGWRITTDGWCTCEPSLTTHTSLDSCERIAQDLEDWAERYRFNIDKVIFNDALDFAGRIRKLAKEDE